jgi:tetratricopeptide (TPR) repeat protein
MPEIGQHEGQYFIAMELLEGQTLKQRISARASGHAPLHVEELLDIGIQIADALSAVSNYDLMENPEMASVYVRGMAYLAAKQGAEAAAEFKKILDYPNVAFGHARAFALVGLGRAYALQSDTVKARKAYQDFLAQWKDADPGIPLLQQAKSEYLYEHFYLEGK